MRLLRRIDVVDAIIITAMAIAFAVLAWAIGTSDESRATVDVPAASGIASLNALTGATQTFAVGTAGTDFAVSSSGSTHTLNLPDASASNRGAVTTGTQTFAGAKTFSTSIETAALTIAGAPAEAVFYRTCTITSAAAADPVDCLAAADVPNGKTAYLTHWHAKVNGATEWATTTACVLEDHSGTDLLSFAVAALTANVFLADGSANVTAAAPYALGTGATAGDGLRLDCDQNGTGSDLVVTIQGVIK